MGLTLEAAPSSSDKMEKHISANLQAVIDEGSVKKNLLEYLTEEFINKAVTEQGYTNLELQAAFSLIKSKDHWKSSIDTVIEIEDFDACFEACGYFTGSELIQAESVGEDKIRVVAEGYFNAIGA